MLDKILILGGYGNTGFLIARLLLQETTDLRLVVAGRNGDRAQQAADDLNRAFAGRRVTSVQADARDPKSLELAFKDVQFVVVASSTTDSADIVARAALASSVDYFDLQLSAARKLSVLDSLRDAIEQQGRCFMTDGGFHPGVPAAMVRYANTMVDGLEAATVSGAFKLNWKELQFSESTVSEFVDELRNFNPTVLKNKTWRKLGMSAFPRVNFGSPYGAKYCSPMFLEELRSLPKSIPTLRNVGFYVSGFNWVTDYITMPIAFTGLSLFGDRIKKPVGKLFLWSLKLFCSPPYGGTLQMEAKGQSESLHMKLTHSDAYALTAIPVVACLLQFREGSIRHPGLWHQANLVEPTQFFKDIERLGVNVEIQRESHHRGAPGDGNA